MNKKLITVIFILFSFNTYASNDLIFIKHSIRSEIWATGSIRWTPLQQEVDVYFGLKQDPEDCLALSAINKKYFKEINDETVNIGKICNRLVALVNYKELHGIEGFKEFTAAHESFHLAIQIFGQPFAFDISLKSEGDYSFVNNFVIEAKESLLTSDCTIISDNLDSLDINKRNFILFKSMYEWPAEYYAKEFMSYDYDDYFKFRRDISEKLKSPHAMELNSLYTLSALFIQAIEKKTPSEEWIEKVNKGESILDIYLKNNGCDTYTESWIKGYVNEYNLF